MNRRSVLSFATMAFCVFALAGTPAGAQEAPAVDAWTREALSLAQTSAQPGAGLAVEIEPGTLDPRLKLAACAQVEPYLPVGFKAWGKTRIGLRCMQGPTRWNVFLPITVKVYGTAWVAANALQAGSVLAAGDLRQARIDLAADPAPAVTDLQDAIGRTLTRSVAAGESLRQPYLRARQWFAAGETVQLVAVGNGFAVQSEGQAIGPGLEGSPVRVRTESGRIVSGQAVGERRVEIRL